MLTLDVAFKGAPEDQKLAAKIFATMRQHGRFMALDVPIKVSFVSLLEYLSMDGVAVEAARIQKIVKSNPAVFQIEELEESSLLVTTRLGRVPRESSIDTLHTFAERMMTPLPKPEPSLEPEPERERPILDERWKRLRSFGADELEQDLDSDLPLEIPIAVRPREIAAPVAAPVGEAPAAEMQAPPIEAVAETAAPEQPTEIAVAPTVAAPAVAAAPEPEQAAARVIRAPSGPVTKFNDVDDLDLAATIGDRLRLDPRVANFGDQWMLEERVPRFSRGDLRRVREYIQEQEQPLTDEVLAQDVLGGRPGSNDFDLLRFGVNFRLSREHREFDFVGTPNQRFWSTSNLPQIGTTRRKPNEIGTDYKFLLDDAVEPVIPRSVKSIDHVLTFYEYHLGLLPFDVEMQTLLTAPVLAAQRSVVLTFECPQSYTTYLVELRFATPNRGGFILGLDDFYNENLIPGAMITLERTDNDGHYLVKYQQAPSKNARLLELEDRRQRYLYRPTAYACGVLDEYLLSEERFPNFASEKPLDEKVRRRAESVVAATFERLNHKSDGPGFVAIFDDLMAAVNIERPFSERYLRSILETDESGAFARDPDGQDAYTYVPIITS